jgi:cysteinyl-tRNA synthetase
VDLDCKGLDLKLYNTLTRQKERLVPLVPGEVSLYTCGPTVYNFAHIGNFRTYIFEDLLRRTIKLLGMKVTQVMNLTDVDDKTIQGALSQNSTLEEYTLPYKQAFFEDLKTLNIEPAEHYPEATKYIQAMIAMIEDLLAKGIAYRSQDGSIYYAISKFPRYGCLSHMHLNELKPYASQRVAEDEYDKENAADFVLWKRCNPAVDGNTFWESPFGPGRPGWHLECSAMAIALLGPSLDIHVGGVDNMFPHHENEIAQSEAHTEKPFATLWMHAEHLIVDNKKMSKSAGNFYTLRDLRERGYSGTQVRYLLLQTHYKTQLNFTFTGLDAAKGTLQRLQDFIRRMQELQASAAGPSSSSLHATEPLLEGAFRDFAAALADDLNISNALAVLFDMIRDLNQLADSHQITSSEASSVLSMLARCNQVLGVLSFEPQEPEIPSHLQAALEQRLAARRAKNWAEADALRDMILSEGYLIEDTATGARLKKIDASPGGGK